MKDDIGFRLFLCVKKLLWVKMYVLANKAIVQYRYIHIYGKNAKGKQTERRSSFEKT